MKLKGLIPSIILITLSTPASVQAYFTGVHVELSVSEDSFSSGDSATINMTVGAYTTSKVETNAVVTLSLPPGTTNAVSSDCTLTEPLTMVCVIPELAPDEDTDISVLATLNLEGNNLITASVNTDELVYDARVDSKIVAVELLPADESPVDLEVEITATSDDPSILKSDYFNLTVTNNHDSNTAKFPFVELALEDSHRFFSGDNCTAAGQLVTCKFARLLPGATNTTEIILNPYQIDDSASVTASINSTQPDTLLQNNNAQYLTTIVSGEILCGGGCQQFVIDNLAGTDSSVNEETESESVDLEVATAEPETTLADSGTGSGGGAVPTQMLLLLLFAWQVPARIVKRRNHN